MEATRFMFIPLFDVVGICEAEEGRVDTSDEECRCSCSHWVLPNAAEDISSRYSSK